MFSALISIVLANFLYLALHIEGSAVFPKPLSAKLEKEYFEKWGDGDEQARAKLIEHNLRLVAHIAKKYYSKTSDHEDLISIGSIGLIKAVNTFSYDKCTKFATYASRCIENEILMHFRGLKKSAGDISINEPVERDSDGDGSSVTILDMLPSSSCLEDDIYLKIQVEKLYNFVNNRLDKREQEIIRLRYGLNGTRSLPQREIANQLGISRSYVSRIEKKALEKLEKEFDNI